MSTVARIMAGDALLLLWAGWLCQAVASYVIKKLLLGLAELREDAKVPLPALLLEVSFILHQG
jgi:hypothetical protein